MKFQLQLARNLLMFSYFYSSDSSSPPAVIGLVAERRRNVYEVRVESLQGRRASRYPEGSTRDALRRARIRTQH